MAATRQTVQSNASTNVKTSIFEKISYGMGDVACNVVFALTSGLSSIRTHQRSDHVLLHQRHERIGGYGRYDNAHFAYF